jgi:hypothetical protein
MDVKPQTSFIPKKPLTPIASVSHSSSVSFSFFGLIAILIFAISILSAGGVMAWKYILEKKQVGYIADLEAAKEAFDPALIQELKSVSMKLTTAKELLNSHAAVSEFFSVLGDATLKSVRFKNFRFSNSGKDLKVTMSGEAESFSSIAKQSDVFGANKKLKDPILSSLALEQNGNVSFDFTAAVEPAILSYSKSVIKAATASSSAQSGATGTTGAPATTTSAPAATTSATGTPLRQ